MPLLWLSLAFLAGILAAGWSGVAWPVWLGIGTAALPLGLLCARVPVEKLNWLAQRDRRLKFTPLLLLVFFGLGGLRYSLAHAPPLSTDLPYYNDLGEFELRGWVADDPDLRAAVTLLRVQIEALRRPGGAAWQTAHGLALVMLAPGADWQYGDRLTFVGKPVTPPADEGFSYQEYLARKGIYTYLAYPRVRQSEGNSGNILLRWILSARAAGLDLVGRLFPSPESRLMEGILLGVDSRIPDDILRAFQATGIAHVIAISGFNMSILSGMFLTIFRRFLNRWWAALAAILALTVYTFLAGAGTSVVRAAVMCAMALIAVQLGREAGGLNALCLSAAGMCLFDPNLPWDVGFQLTFGATLGLILYANALQDWFSSRVADRLPGNWGERIAGPVGEYLLCTLAAQAVTLPVIVWHFRRLSLSALLANPLVLPVQSPLMILGALSLPFGAIWEPFGRLLGWAAWPFAAWTIAVARGLGRLTWGELVLDQRGVEVFTALSVAVLLGITFREKLRAVKLAPLLVLIPLVGLAAFAARAALSAADGRLHLVAFDLPGGPAILLRGPDGKAFLIGGAEAAPRLEEALGGWLPPGARLDGLFVSPGMNQKGLPGVAQRFTPIKAYLCPDMTALSSALDGAFKTAGTPTQLLAQGWSLSDGTLHLEALPAGEKGCALLLRYVDLRVLLPGAGGPGDLPPEIFQDPGLIVLAPPAGWELSRLRLLSPPPGGWIHTTTDGERLWAEMGK